jgi:hypothetical protein
MAGRRPLVDLICKDDINLIAGCWSWLENCTPRLLDFFNVMVARTRRNLSASRFWVVEDF